MPGISRVVSLHMLEAGETRDSNSFISKMKKLILKEKVLVKNMFFEDYKTTHMEFCLIVNKTPNQI